MSVNDKGRVVGTYSNSRTIDLAEITLANFNGANGLKRIDGGAFAATDESGPPTYNAPGKIVGSSLEGSNTDIADEFTKLIVTQQAYSANTRVITHQQPDGPGPAEHAAVMRRGGAKLGRMSMASMSIAQALNTSLSGLRATQAGLSLVASNVANAQTPGYVRKTLADRRRPRATTSAAASASPAINRELDDYLQRQLRVEIRGRRLCRPARDVLPAAAADLRRARLRQRARDGVQQLHQRGAVAGDEPGFDRGAQPGAEHARRCWRRRSTA